MNVTERFLNYVAFDTQSDENSETCPSTLKQKLLGAAIVEDLKAIGVADARMDEYGYVYGSVPGTVEGPVIGLIAHMDTSPDCSGKDVKPRILEYTGGDIVLNAEQDIVMKAKDFERLARSVGKHLIVTDGTTLLGADDKAGVAEILTAVEELIRDKAPHVPIRIGITPDEEVGRGADRFDVKGFGADFAYTADGGTVGEIEFENFNAASAVVEIKGVSIHPGSAKNKMVNAMQVAVDFHAMLPAQERPEHTEGYEGFSMLAHMEGDIEYARLQYIIRDHDRFKFEQKKNRFLSIAAYLNEAYGPGTLKVAHGLYAVFGHTVAFFTVTGHSEKGVGVLLGNQTVEHIDGAVVVLLHIGAGAGIEEARHNVDGVAVVLALGTAHQAEAVHHVGIGLLAETARQIEAAERETPFGVACLGVVLGGSLVVLLLVVVVAQIVAALGRAQLGALLEERNGTLFIAVVETGGGTVGVNIGIFGVATLLRKARKRQHKEQNKDYLLHNIYIFQRVIQITICGYCGVSGMVVLLHQVFCFRINGIEVAQVQRPLCLLCTYGTRHLSAYADRNFEF